MTKQDYLESIRFDNEEWRDIAGSDGQYLVSSLGRVCSYGGRKGNRIMSLYVHADRNKEYASVCIMLNGTRKKVRVHRLVAEAFLPNPNRLKEIDHLNGNGTDNRVENIQWCDRLANMGNAVTRRRLKISSRFRKDDRGLFDRRIAKLKNGIIVATYDSISEIKREGYNDCCVYRCCNGKHKTHAGYEWKYIFYPTTAND